MDTNDQEWVMRIKVEVSKLREACQALDEEVNSSGFDIEINRLCFDQVKYHVIQLGNLLAEE